MAKKPTSTNVRGGFTWSSNFGPPKLKVISDDPCGVSGLPDLRTPAAVEHCMVGSTRHHIGTLPDLTPPPGKLRGRLSASPAKIGLLCPQYGTHLLLTVMILLLD